MAEYPPIAAEELPDAVAEFPPITADHPPDAVAKFPPIAAEELPDAVAKDPNAKAFVPVLAPYVVVLLVISIATLFAVAARDLPIASDVAPLAMLSAMIATELSPVANGRTDVDPKFPAYPRWCLVPPTCQFVPSQII